MVLYQRKTAGFPDRIISREVLKGFRFPSGILYEDLASFYRIDIKCSRIAVVSSYIYAYRKRMDGIVRQDFKPSKLVMMGIMDDMLDFIKREMPTLIDAARSRAFAGLFSIFLQAPEEEKFARKILWERIIYFRRYVIANRSGLMRRKNKIAAIITFLGMDFAWKIGRKYGQKETYGK